MKKLLLVLAVVLAVGVMFAACGEEKKEGNSPVSISNSTKEKDKKEKDSYVGQDDTDPYTANVPNEIIDFYIEKVNEKEDAHKDELNDIIENNPDYDISSLKNLKYDLVFIDDNNTPELVVTDSRGWITVYAYEGGKIVNALGEDERWPFGIAGNAGYEFIPKKNVVFFRSNEFAGMIRDYAYFELKGTKLEQSYVLSEVHFNDDKNDRTPDENDEFLEEATAYYKDDKKVSEKEFNKYLVIKDAEELTGKKSYTEIIAALSSLVNVK
jgi:ABC-type glycerol-3-phosphate transport system substrate-binding protein